VAVNATTITVPGTCTPTDYYVDLLDDTYTTELTTTDVTNDDYSVTAPTISGINGSRVYLASKTDLARFCSIVSYSNPNQPVDIGTVYIDGVVAPVFAMSFSGTNGYDWAYTDLTVHMTSAQTVYSFGSCDNYDYSGASIKCNNESIFYYYGSQATSGSEWDVLACPQDSVFSYGVKGGLSGGANRYGRLRASIVIFDYLDYELSGTIMTTNELLIPPTLANIETYTEPLTSVYQNGVLLGESDNSGYLSLTLPLGTNVLKFVKEGYWDAYETITVTEENNSELFVSLSPKNAIFQVSKEFSGNLYPNSVGTLSMDITPIKNAYAAKLRVSGVEVNKVYYQTQEVPKTADGYYILGDVTSTQNIEIEFETPSSWGEKTFTVELTATDIEGTVYTNLETINYEVLELPFLLEMPETFGIGLNDITLTDQSGTGYSVLMVLYDSDDVEVWSSSTNLLEYCDYTFEVPIDDAGDYILELNAKAGTVKTYYSIEIIEPVTLITEKITANPGKVATVQFKISNPTSNVKYYTAELTCPFFNESINKTFSIAPETIDKTVDMSFEVPEGLGLENYQLSLEIFDPDKTDAIYSGNIVLTISSGSLFMASVPGGNTTLILLAAAVLLIAGTFAALRLKK
jgi:hypothetical protein